MEELLVEALAAEALLALKGPMTWARSPETKQRMASAREVSRKLRHLVECVGAAGGASSSLSSPLSSSPPSSCSS